MGNREALLAGAKECLLEKGYGRTTVRDIATSAGVSMAAIGYHFDSKEALLNAALVELNGKEMGDAIEKAVNAVDPGADPLEQFATTWDTMGQAVARHRRLLATTLENLAQAERSPKVRDQLADGHRAAIAALAEMLHPADGDPETAQALGAFYYTLLNGLISQWLVDPEHAPSGQDLARAVRALNETHSPRREGS